MNKKIIFIFLCIILGISSFIYTYKHTKVTISSPLLITEENVKSHKYDKYINLVPNYTFIYKDNKKEIINNHAYNIKEINIDNITDSDIIYSVILYKNLLKDNKVYISDISEACVELYGEDEIIDNYEINFGDNSSKFIFKDNKYILEGKLSNKENEEEFITKVTKNENYLYIYNKNIPYYVDDDNIYIYKDFLYKKIVNKIKYNDISNKELTNYELKKILMKKYKNNIIFYKHTFKKDDNNYYYISSSIIK